MNFNPYYSNYLQNLSSDRSFNYRRSVNVLSLVIILVTYLNIVPSEIAALGITLEGTDQKQLVGILLLVDAYLFLAFSFRTYIDYQKHHSIVIEKAYDHLIEMAQWLTLEGNKFEEVVDTKTELESEKERMEKFLEMAKDEVGLDKYITEHGFKIGDKRFKNPREMNKYLQKFVNKKLELNELMDRRSSDVKVFNEIINRYREFKDNSIIKNIDQYSKLYWSFYVLVPASALIISIISVYFY